MACVTRIIDGIRSSNAIAAIAASRRLSSGMQASITQQLTCMAWPLLIRLNMHGQQTNLTQVPHCLAYCRPVKARSCLPARGWAAPQARAPR